MAAAAANSSMLSSSPCAAEALCLPLIAAPKVSSAFVTTVESAKSSNLAPPPLPLPRALEAAVVGR